jgi:glyoxylase-like metal-dependent hydrolase (beta-lactamase superfamily II)/8-oxo-dGTP pyrophosphatase MutT (NUDIX family)
VSVITPAASVLLTRGPGSRELFAILRGQHLKFFGGFWAFPGGKLSAEDTEAIDHLEARRTAACRELFEETGVLVARRSDGSFPTSSPDLDACRHALLAEQLPFARMLAERDLSIRAEDFALIGEITTPDFAPLRYATTFFVAHVPPGQQPVVWPGELERGEWTDANHLLAQWRSSEILLTPPTVMSLETLDDLPIDSAPQRLGPLFKQLAHGAIHPIFFAPFIRMLPLKTAGLPPSTHTNAYIVGNSPRYLIDPGAEDAAEQKYLVDFLKNESPLTAIVLTHHHPDHIGAAVVCADRFQLPIWAHAQTAQKLQGRLNVDRLLDDGDRLDLGPCPGDPGHLWLLEVLHTPGHASGHLAFYEPFYRLLFAGDMISTLSSMVIAPPDGNLAEYLQSLQRLRDLPARLLLPSHGNVSAKPIELIDAALAHRAKREMQLLDSLASEPAAVEELTERLYRGTPEPLMRFARAQVLAGLLKLQAEGRACPLDAGRWQRSGV